MASMNYMIVGRAMARKWMPCPEEKKKKKKREKRGEDNNAFL